MATHLRDFQGIDVRIDRKINKEKCPEMYGHNQGMDIGRLLKKMFRNEVHRRERKKSSSVGVEWNNIKKEWMGRRFSVV